MYNQRVVEVGALPVPITLRKSTDVICACLHWLFVVAMLAVAILTPTAGAYVQRQSFCSHPHYYLWSTSSPQGMMCVDECPQDYRPVEQVCYPLPLQALQAYLQQSPFLDEWRQAHLKPIILFTIILAASLSLVLLTLSYFAPWIFQRLMTVLFFLCFLYMCLVCVGLLESPYLFRQALGKTSEMTRRILGAMGGLMGIGLLGWMVCFNGEFSWNGLMMEYAAKVLPGKIVFIWFILKYYTGMMIAFVLFAYQCHSFSHSSSLLLAWTVTPSLTPLQILNIIQYLWNLQLMKDSLYLSLAAITTSFYFSQEVECCSIESLNCLHSGSKAGGALVETLFCIPHCILQGLCCCPQEAERENCGLCCTSLTGIARQDAYAYQAISGIPYCNSSRQCRKLSNQSQFWKGVPSPLANYRFMTHCLANGVCLGTASMVMMSEQLDVTLWSMCALLMLCDGVISGLVDILPVLAQSLQTSLLVDAAISNPKEHIYVKLKALEGDLRVYLQNRKAVDPFTH